jgi:putative endonuclease
VWSRLKRWWKGRIGPAHLDTGLWGEKQAEVYLRRRGMSILGRRVRAGRRDEIDLVARDGSSLVFVEVKTRRNEDFGRPMDSVDRRKRQTLSRGAVRYLRARGGPGLPFRFDVVEVIGAETDAREPSIRHIPNAFPLDRRYQVPSRPY